MWFDLVSLPTSQGRFLLPLEQTELVNVSWQDTSLPIPILILDDLTVEVDGGLADEWTEIVCLSPPPPPPPISDEAKESGCKP